MVDRRLSRRFPPLILADCHLPSSVATRALGPQKRHQGQEIWHLVSAESGPRPPYRPVIIANEVIACRTNRRSSGVSESQILRACATFSLRVSGECSALPGLAFSASASRSAASAAVNAAGASSSSLPAWARAAAFPSAAACSPAATWAAAWTAISAAVCSRACLAPGRPSTHPAAAAWHARPPRRPVLGGTGGLQSLPGPDLRCPCLRPDRLDAATRCANCVPES